MLSQKPHIILIPGASHTKDCYHLIVPLLEAEGYPVTALTLPSVGAEPPVTSLDPDIEHIRSHTLPILDKGNGVVVVMHSYSGVVGSSSLIGLSQHDRQCAGLPGGVTALVYLTAWIPQLGQSIRSSGSGLGGKDRLSKVKEEGNYIRYLDPVFSFYNDLPEAQAAQYASKLVHHSLPTLWSPLTYAAYQHIPTTYLVCENDNAIPRERQLKLIEETGCPITTVTCDAGHSPFLSQPELTVRVIRHAAGESIQI